MKPFSRGRYVLRVGVGAKDLHTAQRLRYRAFYLTRGHSNSEQRDADAYDDGATQVLVLDRETGDCVACFRFRVFSAQDLTNSYSAQWYDLTPLVSIGPKMVEIGRLCLAPELRSPDPMRLCMGAIARIVEDHGASAMFGCASMMGADPDQHAGILAYLSQHIGPADRVPGKLAPLTTCFPHDAPPDQPKVPALLQSYLSLGGWVSDHAVIDSFFDTVHVLTVVETARIPPSRVRALRMILAD